MKNDYTKIAKPAEPVNGKFVQLALQRLRRLMEGKGHE